MVQVIPRFNLGAQIGQALSQGLQSGSSSALSNKLMQDQMRLQNELSEGSKLRQTLLENQLTSQKSNEMKERLLKLGVPEEVASLYSEATEGGKTAILQNLMDLEQRGLLGEGIFNKSRSSNETSQSRESSGFQFPEIPTSKGLKPNEAITRENSREKINIPLYNETKGKLRNFDKESLSLQRLNQLNNSGKLPTGFGKFNINPRTGELFFPALANPETQLFVKTINDFTTKAKDSYGARVTNFELDRFLKRLPTLANSPEGRQLIIDQMNAINDLDKLEEQSLIDTYDHYGVGRINSQQASMIASKYRAEKENILKRRFEAVASRIGSIERNQVPQGKVLMLDPQGNVLHVPEDQVEEALKRGATRK